MKIALKKMAWRAFLLVKRCLKAAPLPLSLILLFVGQNAAFNVWLHIVPDLYVRMYAATFALGVLIYGPALFLRARFRYHYLLLTSFLVSILLVTEYLFYSYSEGFFQISALRFLGQSEAFLGTAAQLVHPRLVLFCLGPLLVAAVHLRARHRKLFPLPLPAAEKICVLFFILASIFGGYHVLLATEKRDWGDSSRLFRRQYDLNSVVGKMGIANYFLEDAAKRVLAKNDTSVEDKAFVKEWSAKRPAPHTRHDLFGLAKGRNVIFIQVESLEQAVMDVHLGDAEITPNLNALAKEGLSFSNFYAQVGLGNTADTEFATLNALYPLPDSVAFVDRAQNTYTALPKLLTSHGYQTVVFHGDVPTFWNRVNIYPNLGYQTWYMKDAYTSTNDIGITGLGDEDFFQQSLPKLKTLPQPFFATLITLSSHTPFVLPEPLRTLSVPAESGLDETQTRYLESIHYTDRVIGYFINQLKKTNLYDRSLIVLFGDHGSYTGISEALHTKDGVKTMNDARVPLIILAPGSTLKGKNTAPGGQLDLYPTITNLLGMDAPRSVLGQDLLNTQAPVAVRRKKITGGIEALVGTKNLYQASADGEFLHGACVLKDTLTPIAIEDCRALYEEQSALLRVSDTVIRANMVNALE